MLPSSTAFRKQILIDEIAAWEIEMPTTPRPTGTTWWTHVSTQVSIPVNLTESSH
jgi:hypothetical protein